MLIAHDLIGNIEPITDYELPQRKWILNGQSTLHFSIYETMNNKESFGMIVPEGLIECEEDLFRIKQYSKRMVGEVPFKQLGCLHVIHDLEFGRVYTKTSGTLSINQAMDMIVVGTGNKFTYSIEGSFPNVSFTEFGNQDCWELFKKVLEEFQAEFDAKQYHIILKNRVGEDKDFQFRYKHNMTNVEETFDTNDLRTYIKGTGKKDANGNPLVSTFYRSTNADIFGERHAEPIEAEQLTTETSLQNHLKTQIQDTPLVSAKFDYSTLVNEIEQDIEKGDAGFMIHEELGIDIYTRVVEITDYPGIDKDPVFTIGNVLKNGTQEILQRR